MTSLESIFKQLNENWIVIATICGAIFYLQKIRAEETLKTKLTLVYDCYTAFAQINDLVQDWASPAIQTTAHKKDEDFAVELSKKMPEAVKYFHKASILMRPETVRALHKIFLLLNQINAQYGIWKMYLRTESFSEELTRAFDRARTELPNEIDNTVFDLLTDFQIVVHGSFRLLWWNMTGFSYPCFRQIMNNKLKSDLRNDRNRVGRFTN